MFGGNMVAQDQMTYVLVDNDTTNEFTEDQLKRMNVLNGVWNKINLVRLGYEFDVDITSTFFMIEETSTNKQIVATFPGQELTVSSFTNYDFYNSAKTAYEDYITCNSTSG